jgi:hypothetical protein
LRPARTSFDLIDPEDLLGNLLLIFAKLSPSLTHLNNLLVSARFHGTALARGATDAFAFAFFVIVIYS